MKKKRYMRYLIFSLLVCFFLAGQAIAGVPAVPTFDLYETVNNTPTGTFAETPPPVNISAGLTGVPFTGILDFYYVLTETSDTTNHQITNWSDVLHFQFLGLQDAGIGLDQLPLSATVQLLSDPAFNSLPVDAIISGAVPRLFHGETAPPTLLTLTAASNSGTFFSANFNVYSDFTEGGDTDRPVPEPSTFLLLGAGLAGVGLMRRKFKK